MDQLSSCTRHKFSPCWTCWCWQVLTLVLHPLSLTCSRWNRHSVIQHMNIKQKWHPTLWIELNRRASGMNLASDKSLTQTSSSAWEIPDLLQNLSHVNFDSQSQEPLDAERNSEQTKSCERLSALRSDRRVSSSVSAPLQFKSTYSRQRKVSRLPE